MDAKKSLFSYMCLLKLRSSSSVRLGVGVAAALLLITAKVASAWDGQVAGKIVNISVAPAGNYPLRVFLEGSPALCGNANTWASLDDADGNYKVFAAALMSAKTSGNVVTLYTTRDSTGYCKIGYVSWGE